MYEIKVTYQTGHSLHSEVTTDVIELTWKDLDVAKQNLKRIQEHYTMYKELTAYTFKKNTQEILKRNEDKEWFVKDPTGDVYMSEFHLILIADNGNSMQMYAFWCGHFEELYEAEIINNDEDLKISF